MDHCKIFFLISLFNPLEFGIMKKMLALKVLFVIRDFILIKKNNNVKNASSIIVQNAIAQIFVFNVLNIIFGIVKNINAKFFVLPLAI